MNKPRFYLPISILAFIVFITTFLIGVIWIEMYHDAYLQAINLIKPLPMPFLILDNIPTWARYGVYFIAGLFQAFIATSCLCLIRCVLPEKYKACIPWRKLKDE